jgi:hypothetical protein
MCVYLLERVLLNQVIITCVSLINQSKKKQKDIKITTLKKKKNL